MCACVRGLVSPQRRPKRCLLQAAKDEEHANKDDDKERTAHNNLRIGVIHDENRAVKARFSLFSR